MRIHILLSKNTQPIDFNYQQKQVGAIHKWLGQNEIHDKISLYSFSWLKGGRKEKENLNFPNGAKFFISFYDSNRIKDIIKGIQDSPEAFCGMKVNDILIQETPKFGTFQKFFTESPVFLKYTIDKISKYYYYTNPESEEILTNNGMNKLKQVGKASEAFKVYFDSNYHGAYTKGATFKGIFNKGSICPIIVEGTPEQIAFIWDVGIGNSTGIGFGSLSIMD